MNLLGVAAFAILVFQPRALADVSFQLSFAAVAGILVAMRWLSTRWRADRQQGALRRFWTQLVQGFAVSCGAWAATAPILAWQFRAVSLLAPLANLIVIPWSSLLIAVGLLLYGVGLFLPWAAAPFAASFSLLAHGLAGWVDWAAGLERNFANFVKVW